MWRTERDSGDVGVLCTNIPAAAAGDIARSSQLSSFLSGQAVWPAMAGGSAFHHSTNQVTSTLFLAKPCWVVSLRPSHLSG
jgi:hypothetical protein